MLPVRSIVAALGIGLLAVPLHAAEGSPPRPNIATSPNILLILADDLGYSDLGCYGGEIETPNLDALAKNGLRYTQFYNTARCWPTRGALLSGYYAQATGRDAGPGIQRSPARPPWGGLLPEFLRPVGYRSYHSGKWHIDGPVLASAFDHSYSLEDHNRNFHPQKHTEDDKPLEPVAANAGYFTSTAVAEHAIKCLREHAAEHADKPFFSYVAFTSPHFPLQAPATDIAKYENRYQAGWEAVRAARYAKQQSLGLTPAKLSETERDLGPPYAFPDDIAKLGPGEVNRPLPWDQLSDEQQKFQADKMAVHAAMIDRMDQEIGRIIAQLKAMNAMENTLILFASDNGASAEIMVRGDGHDPAAAPGSAATFLCLGPGWSTTANTPFRRHKTWVHEGGIATPLIVHWPRGIAARGELRTTPGHVVDFVPTALELAGATKPATYGDGKPTPKLHGRSLVGTFGKDAPIADREPLWWLHEGNRAVRVGDWKLVAAKDQPWELFDLADDRSETNNLAAAQPEKVRELEAVWQKRLEEMAELANRDPRPPQAPGGKKGQGKKAAKKRATVD
jgi:arylsulfatase